MRASASREVRRHGRFADAALAARHRHDKARALEANLAGLLAQLGLNLAHLELDLGHAQFVRQDLMNPRSKIAQDFLAIGRAAQRDCVRAVRRGRDLLTIPSDTMSAW